MTAFIAALSVLALATVVQSFVQPLRGLRALPRVPGCCAPTNVRGAALRCVVPRAGGRSSLAVEGGSSSSSSSSVLDYDALEGDLLSLLRGRVGQRLCEVAVDSAYASAEGFIGSGGDSSSSRDCSKAVRFAVKAYRSQQFKYIRSAKFTSADKSFNVLNFVVLPDLSYNCNMPVFGIDLVVLPGAAVIAIDFQPVCGEGAESQRQYYSSNPFYQQLVSRHKEVIDEVRGRLPVVAVPVAVQRYFSPHCAYCRMRLADIDEGTVNSVRECVLQYLDAYLSVSDALGEVPGGDAVGAKAAALNEYLTYRNGEATDCSCLPS